MAFHFRSVQQASFKTLLFIPGAAFMLRIPGGRAGLSPVGQIAAKVHDTHKNLTVYPWYRVAWRSWL